MTAVPRRLAALAAALAATLLFAVAAFAQVPDGPPAVATCVNGSPAPCPPVSPQAGPDARTQETLFGTIDTGTCSPPRAASDPGTNWRFQYEPSSTFNPASPAYSQATAFVNAGNTSGAQQVSVTISGLQPGTSYHWRIDAFNRCGANGAAYPADGADATFTTAFAPPPAPGGVSATAGHGRVTVAWSAAPGATGYKVYRGTLPGGESSTPVGTTAGTSFTDTTVTNGTTYYYFVVAGGPGGDSPRSNEVSATPQLPAPSEGRSVNAFARSGTVLVKFPAHSAAAARARTTGFVPLSKAGVNVPVGSTFDATHGRMHLVTASNLHGGTQAGDFSKGRFIVHQRRHHPLTTLAMTGGGLSACHVRLPGGGAARVVAARRRHRTLFSNVHGHYRTRGRNSTATVRGTEWVQKDTCSGTTTSVRRGTVVVRDLAKHRSVVLHKGQRYLARPPGR